MNEIQRNFMMSLYEKEEEMISKLRAIRKAEIEKFSFGYLEKSFQRNAQNWFGKSQKFELTSQ
jgi:hypothetical protein